LRAASEIHVPAAVTTHPGEHELPKQKEMISDEELLRQLISFNVPAAPVAIPALVILYLFYPDPIFLVLAASILPTFVLQRFAVRYSNQGRVSEGVTTLSAAIWCPTLAMAIFAPRLWALTCIFCILSVVLALPFVDGRHLLRLLFVASGILVIGGVSTMIDPPLAFDEAPEKLVAGVVAFAALVGGILCMFSIRQSNERLRSTLGDTEKTNKALRESEQSLERKVADRTAELGEARDAALHASRVKSDFLANMSHELRTPLNAIIGYGEMLQEEVVENNDGDYLPDLGRIVTSGRQLLGLINDVLDLSKVEAGKVDVQLEDFDLEEFVRDVEGTVIPLVQTNSNTLEVRCAPALGTMHSDVSRIRQVLLNLLSNASKFTSDGAITLEVERQTSPTDVRQICFRVSDTGIGMTAEQLGRVFDAFSQAEAATASEFGGTGLGLAITRKFCEMLGGSIDCETEPGVGSVFEVWLPDHEREEIDGGRASSELDERSAQTTVLVVDDDEAARDLVSRFLRREGFTARTANTGEEALRSIRESKPDVIALDVIMPGMDGWDVLRTLKADPDLADIPVILMTITSDRKLGYALGATEYLTKPVDWNRLSGILAGLQIGTRRTALVVDDDPAARDIARRVLERAGWQIREAENGRIALDAVADETPSLIVLDLMMPEMDGFEFVVAMHERSEWRLIPIIVVTSMDVSAADRERLGGGVGRILQKGDYTLLDLTEEIHRLVNTDAKSDN
jgi:signal transduction histidine kinase/DNA-binding response OmpR family regulator